MDTYLYTFERMAPYKGNSPKSKEIPKILFLNFLQDFFISKKNSEKKYFLPYQSEISPGIQKSYLENRATSLNIPKMEIPNFITNFARSMVRVTYNYP